MTLRERILPIRLLALDVDGVLSQGGIDYSMTGGEGKSYYVRDGSGLKRWHLAGGTTAIVTGRSSPLVAVRAAETGIFHVVQGCLDKRQALEEWLRMKGMQASAACFVGDDIIDVGAMQLAGLAVAVADGCTEARESAHYITRAAGGRGAVREVIELVMRCQGTW